MRIARGQTRQVGHYGGWKLGSSRFGLSEAASVSHNNNDGDGDGDGGSTHWKESRITDAKQHQSGAENE